MFLEPKFKEFEPVNKLGMAEQYRIKDGIKKRLVIMHKPYGGNDMYFYDQNFVPIIDLYSLYNAYTVYFVNHKRIPGDNLEGKVLFDREAVVRSDAFGGLKFDRLFMSYFFASNTSKGMTFKDEYGLSIWEEDLDKLKSDVVFTIE